MANPAAYRARVTRAGRSPAAFIRIAALTLSSARTFTENTVNRWRTNSSMKAAVKASCVKMRIEEVEIGR